MLIKMKNIYKIALIIGIPVLSVSCKKHEALDFSVEKPASIAAQEQIDAYNALKSYFNWSANPNFKLGVATSLTEYNNKGVLYRLANSNFNQIVIGYEMKHGAIVKDDGSMDFDNVKKLLENAKNSNMEVYGHTLCWHANQNAKYLNSLIAPTVIKGTSGPALEDNLISNGDFESGNISGWFGWGNSSVREVSAKGDGYGGTGYALNMSNPKVVNSWEAQTAMDFTTPFQNASTYKLSFYVKGSVAGAASVAAQETKSYGADDFGSFNISTDWKLVQLEKTITAGDRTRLVFSFGAYAGKISMDKISINRVNPNGGDKIIEKTADEKKAILTAALDKWIAGMLAVSKASVKAWDVVNEPMSDWPDPSLLKTGVGKTNIAADEFYWQDYLGKDYAVTAFKLARQYGNATDIHFINDYGLENSLDKCRGLIEYVKYIESKGAKVDGIGTQMHMGTENDKTKIAEMFKLLAATGKLIKISELDLGVSNKKTAAVTPDEYKAQADMYRYVIDKYFEIIPPAQRYGITIWSPLDSPASSFWRPDEPIGLWTGGFVRKPAYVGVAEALKGK